MVNKSKQTIERTIKQIKEMGFDTEMYETNIETIDKYKEKEVITTLYYNEDLEMGIYINFQEVGYPTLFELCFFEENWKTKEMEIQTSERFGGMKYLKDFLLN
jgi:transposase